MISLNEISREARTYGEYRQRLALRGVLVIVRKLKRTKSKTLRIAIERKIRKTFNFDEFLCSKCRQWKPRSAFHLDKGKADGIRCSCAECERKRAKEGYRKHIDRNREYARKKYWQKKLASVLEGD